MTDLLNRMIALGCLVAAALTGVACIAALAPLTPRELQAGATHIIRGKVLRIYTSVERTSDGMETTYAVAEIQVAKQEMGDPLGRVAYVRFLSRRNVGGDIPWAGDVGIQNPPKPGARVLVFAALAEDGGLDAVRPNGLHGEN